MNKFVKSMLMRDGRNPYGSRGGYVSSRKRRDYGYDSESNRMGDYGRYYPTEYEMGGRYGEHYNYDRHDYPMRDYGNRDYGYRDYGEYGKLSQQDIEQWKHQLRNEDGSMGEHFRKEQIEQHYRQMGIQAPMETFYMAVNMMYSDYCKVAQKYGIDRLDFYCELAKAFLQDSDFQGDGEEKLYLYYKCIAEDDR